MQKHKYFYFIPEFNSTENIDRTMSLLLITFISNEVLKQTFQILKFWTKTFLVTAQRVCGDRSTQIHMRLSQQVTNNVNEYLKLLILTRRSLFILLHWFSCIGIVIWKRNKAKAFIY